MESSGAAGRINISSATYQQVKDFFDCEFRGKVQAKNKGAIDMYFVNSIKSELATDSDGQTPNKKFFVLYDRLA